MAAGPAVTAIILTVITFSLTPRVSIGGDAYDQLIWGKEFQTGTASPSLYIIEIHSEVQQLTVQAAAGKPIGGITSDIAGRQTQYERDYSEWVNRLTDPQARNDLTASHEAATEYFKLYQQRLLPAVRAGRDEEAAALLESQMARALGDHRSAAQSAAYRVQNQVDAQEAAVSSQAQRQAFGIIAITLLMIAASTALGLTVLRSIIDRVRRLNEVATVELPQVLDEVKRAALAGEDIPSLPASRGEGGDELAAAAVAFNSVVATAVELAAEQSRLRRSTSQMFINLGRRNHKLLSRTLTYITQLESDERDPATLQNLFRLDHLTTRMRRHAESLLVLAGSPPLRTWSRPVPVADVLRAALSEIETYDRVDIKELEPVEVRGASVSDLAHLLAELLENATAFSPPQTRVRVLGRIDSDGYTVVVVDEGIGMSPNELESANQLINSPDDSGILSDSRMLGLGVVGRLAGRHGFKVNLTASPVGGVVAWVTLPTSALAPRRGGTDTDSVGGLTASGLLTTPESLPRQTPAELELPGFAAPSGEDAEQPGPAGPVVPATNGKPAAGGLGSSVLPLRRPGRDAENEDDAGAFAPAEAPGAEADGSADSPAAAATAASAATTDEPSGRTSATPLPAAATTAPAIEGAEAEVVEAGAPSPTGAIPVTSRAAVVASPATGSVIIPPAPEVSPVSGPIAFRKPPAGPGEQTTLTRRVRGAQLPDTGEAPAGTPGSTSGAPARPDRSAQSVRGALQSFSAGRKTASEVTLSTSRPPAGPLPTGATTSVVADPSPTRPQPTVSPVLREATPDRPAPVEDDEPAAVAGTAQLPRRVRGAQLPATDLPEATAPAPGRNAADVRAALSNFVAGRRAAEHED